MNRSFLSFRLAGPWALLLLLSLLMMAACGFTAQMPVEWGYENSLVENVQMAVLAGSFLLCLTARSHVAFYRLAAFVVLFLMLREISFGRTIFFPVEGKVDTFYKWKEIPYGWLAHWVVGAYLAALGLVFVLRCHWRSVRAILCELEFPVWGIALTVAAACVGRYAEAHLHDAVAEEIAELGMYLAFTYVVAVYTRREETSSAA